MASQSSARHIVTLTLLFFLGLLPLLAGAAQARVIAVLYPELEEPYRSVFSSIIEGIQEQSAAMVRLLPVADGSDSAHLVEPKNLLDVSAIIALGRTAFAAAEQWRGKIPIIVGALLLVPDKGEQGVAGISLAADPHLLLERLNHLAPSVKRVHVVYSPDDSEWLIQIAQNVCSKLNIKLRAYKSNDIKASALIYRDILNNTRPGEDAIWLLPDPVAVDSRIILPLLLRGAWNNNIELFSSNPGYVKRGALFALFPDNKLMGRSLAKLAESYLGADAAEMRNFITPLKDLQAAINVRTADHNGLTLSSEERKDYALIFPAP